MAGFLKSLFGKEDATTASEAAPSGSDAHPVHVTAEIFDELVLKSPLPALVDFWAPWCGPCRMIAPIVEDLARDYDGRAVIAKINTDEDAQLAGQLGIMGIPTLILFQNGQEVNRIVGYAPRHVLEDMLQAALG